MNQITAQTIRHLRGVVEPVLLRLQSGASCSPELLARVEALATRLEALPPKTILQRENTPVLRPRYLVSGWACRYRHLADGRRQIYDVVLPGEGVGVCLRANPLSNTSIAALTAVRLVDAAPLLRPEVLSACPDLVPALQSQTDADERRMLNQIVRLGRLTALERVANFFLDVQERFLAIGIGADGRFPMSLTQETIADLAGLSVVHVNRTLQELRRQDLVCLERGWLRIIDRQGLAHLANYEVGASRS